MRTVVRSWFHRLAALALTVALGAATRKQWVNWHVVEALEEAGQNYILSLWHNNSMYLAYVFRRRGLGTLVSPSRDGDWSNWVQLRLGYRPVRGSSDQRGANALRGTLRHLRGGGSIAITPDGPRGPRYIIKPGVAALAMRTGVPVLPVVISTPRALELRSWDRLRLPWPGSRVTIYVANTLRAGPEDTDVEAFGRRIETVLRRAAAEADRFAGGDLLPREPLLAEAVEG